MHGHSIDWGGEAQVIVLLHRETPKRKPSPCDPNHRP